MGFNLMLTPKEQSLLYTVIIRVALHLSDPLYTEVYDLYVKLVKEKILDIDIGLDADLVEKLKIGAGQSTLIPK
jgi:hypothetical protein